ARSPVEVEESPGEVSRGVLDEEMTVQKESLNAREVRVVAVEVSPASLDHPDAGVRELGNDLEQEAGRRDEVRVEDGDEFSPGPREPLGERPCLEAGPGFAAQDEDIVPVRPELFDERSDTLARVVGRVVEHLD